MSLLIYEFPQIMVIHLKRFSYTERLRYKLNVMVNLSIYGLDISNYVGYNVTQCFYTLYAISNGPYEYNALKLSTLSPKILVSDKVYVFKINQTDEIFRTTIDKLEFAKWLGSKVTFSKHGIMDTKFAIRKAAKFICKELVIGALCKTAAEQLPAKFNTKLDIQY